MCAADVKLVKPGDEVLQATLTLTDPRVDQVCPGDNVDLIAERVVQCTVKPDEKVFVSALTALDQRVDQACLGYNVVWTLWARVATPRVVLAMSWCVQALGEGTSSLDVRVIHVQYVGF